MTSAEQQARDLLERMGVEGAQSFSAGDLVELANLIADQDHHATRWARFQLKQLHQQLGKQSETIYRLRCELAECREINSKIERGDLRRSERFIVVQRDTINNLCELNEELRAKIPEDSECKS